MAQAGIIGEKEFARLITTQDNFSLSDMQTIDRLIAQYPYCQAFYYIQTAALKRTRSEYFEQQLQRSSAFSPDRESLFRYIEKPRELRSFLNTPSEAIAGSVNDTTYNQNRPVAFTEESVDASSQVEEIEQTAPGDYSSPEVENQSESVEEVEDIRDTDLNETDTDQTSEPQEEISIELVDDAADTGTLGFLTSTLPDNAEEQGLPADELEEVVFYSQDIDGPDEEIADTTDAVLEGEGPVFDEIKELHVDEPAILNDTASGIANVVSELEVQNEVVTADTELAEEDIFDEISEVPVVEEQIVVDEAFSKAEIETSLAIEESVGDEPGDQVSKEILVDNIETEIPSIETPQEEFSKPEIDFEAQEFVQQTETTTTDILAATPIMVAAKVPDISIDIETVVPDLDLQGFGSLLTNDETATVYVNDSTPHEFHVEQVAEEIESIEPVPADYPEERLMLDSVAARDYFVFDRSVVDPLGTSSRENKEVKEAEAAPQIPVINIESEPELPAAAAALPEKEAEDVSKYHDDTLPFSFLWWLHKTRKEYDSTYQPYISKPSIFVSSTPAVPNTDLNQQIIESIFHAQPELNTFPEHTLVTYSISPKKREGDLIERFIKEEPHIKPPASDNLNTENKAKRSSEDSLDLVSETLAKIYIDQMLFHKAIDTYKKLSLKFPEKSTYFADQISDLQKKIN